MALKLEGRYGPVLLSSDGAETGPTIETKNGDRIGTVLAWNVPDDGTAETGEIKIQFFQSNAAEFADGDVIPLVGEGFGEKTISLKAAAAASGGGPRGMAYFEGSTDALAPGYRFIRATLAVTIEPATVNVGMIAFTVNPRYAASPAEMAPFEV